MKKLFILLLLLFLCSCTSPMIPLFEGDCVDRAIEIRQKLRGDGYDADIVIGTVKLNGKTEGHAWIKYKEPEDKDWIRYENF